MKVLYLIASVNHGQGGHLHSMRDLAENLRGEGIVPVVAVVGDGKATRVFDSLDCRKYFFLMRRAGEMKEILEKLESVVRVEQPDAIHSFGSPALFGAMYLSRIFRVPFVHTQLDGMGPGARFPRIPYCIVYSKEGEAYFKNNPKYRETELFCFPNRVARVTPDRARIARLKNELRLPPGFIFLRVARICELYRESFLKSIALVERLNKDGIQANLLVVGVKEDLGVFEELKRRESVSVRIVTGDEYTSDADNLMDIADCIIGAGNSFMAAASLGKILLTPPSFARYPVLVDESNFEKFFFYNFRCTFPRPADFELDEGERYAALIRLLQSDRSRERYREFSLELFAEHFDVRKFVKEYIPLLSRLEFRSLASVKEEYRRLFDTLSGESRRTGDGVSAGCLRLMSIAILSRMQILSWFRRAGLMIRNRMDGIIDMAAAHGLEIREFRLKKKTYDLVVLAAAHNEEQLMPQFLRGAAAVADGIVLLDDGSTDGTNETAIHEKIVLKVRKRAHVGFRDLENRNMLLSLAEHISARWFLFLDIDEVVDDRYRDTLRETVRRSDADIVELGIVNLWGDNSHVRVDTPPPSVNGVLWRPRLFRKKDAMHIVSSKQLHFSLIPYQTNRQERRPIMVRHYGNMTKERRRMRYERYRKEDGNLVYQPSYEHIIAEDVVLKPIEVAREEVDRAGVL
jgi:hypothetical protein